MFTAPTSGVYVFSWTVITGYNGYIFTDIVVNSSIKGAIKPDAQGLQAVSSAAALVVLQVNKNDVVFIRTNPIDNIQGEIISFPDQRTTFSGWLLG
jgi:hypothetical protein